MSPSVIKGQNPDTGLDECMTCYQRRRRREQGYVPPDAVKLNKRVARSRNKIEEGLLDLGFSPAEATDTINEIANRCSALYRFIHGMGPGDDVDMPTDVNVNIQDEPEQDEEEVAVDTAHDVNGNLQVSEPQAAPKEPTVDVDTTASTVNSKPAEKPEWEHCRDAILKVIPGPEGIPANRLLKLADETMGRKLNRRIFYAVLADGLKQGIWKKSQGRYYVYTEEQEDANVNSKEPERNEDCRDRRQHRGPEDRGLAAGE
jgi:hypothetical protein